MTSQKPLSSSVWILALVLSAAFVAALTVHRVRRVMYVSSLAGGAEMAVHSGSSLATAVLPRLIVPERNERSFDVIARVRRMGERKEWRVRHVDFENAPQGHEVMTTSPYAWWVGTIAWIDQRMTGNPLTTSVGRASLWADPLAQLLFLIVLTLVVAQQWGGGAAAAFSLGCAGLYPFAAAFWPGAPDPQAVARLLGLASVLLIAIGLTKSTAPGKWFAWSGVIAGLALWVDVPTAMMLLAGIVVGRGLSVLLIRGGDDRATNETGARSCWRVWGLAGATTVLIGYVIEYAPAYLGLWHLETVHPLYGIAWLGAGELMTQLENWRHRRVARFSRGNVFSLVLGPLAIAALPVTLSLSGSRGYIVRDLLSLRLTNEPGGAVATDFWSWVARDGLNARVLATMLPLLGLLLLAWWMRSTPGDPSRRRVLAIGAGPLLVALGVATRQLSAWSVVDGALLILIAAGIATTPTITGRSALSRVLAGGLLIACLTIPGAVQLWPRGRADASLVLTASEAEELIERDLAHWLRMRAEQKDAVVFAPPRETVTLAHYGGFRGIGTFSAENTKGFGTSLMIAGVQTMEEVQALLQPRAVRYIIVPSWDPFFDEFGQLYLAKNFSNRKSFFIGELRRGNLPRWLRPLAYPMPEIPGFEKQSVLVFAVVDEQGPAVAASRLAEYFVETGELDRAASVAAGLRRFPGDVSALTAQAQVLGARDNEAGFGQAVVDLQSRLANGGDRYLPWDRRVALAVVLARAGKIDTAKDQALRCWAEANGSKLKALSAGSLFGLLVLGDTFKPEIEPPLRSLALELLPAGLRAKL